MKKLIALTLITAFVAVAIYSRPVLLNKAKPMADGKTKETKVEATAFFGASTSIDKTKEPAARVQDASPFAPSPELQQIQELSQLQKQVREINERTHFDSKLMTDKEWEDAVALLETYHRKMTAFRRSMKEQTL